MTPTLTDGAIALFVRRKQYQVGDVVLARREDREVVKRIQTIDRRGVYLVGDNSIESTDSRHYGPVPKSAIIGIIMSKFHFAVAVPPPKLVRPEGIWLGRVLAAFYVAIVLVQLFRIDTFIPILDQVIPGGAGWATTFALLVIFSEMFAIPFLLRMDLSPLAHIKSGALVVFAPLWWFLLTIWALGLPDSIGEFGEFVHVSATPALLFANLLWLALGYYTLYALGYNNLKWADMLAAQPFAKKSTASKKSKAKKKS